MDLTRFLRPGDLVTWGQACAEPRTLTDLLVAQSSQVPGLRCFVGIPADSAVRVGSTGDLEVLSYCGTGTNAALHDAGGLEILPVHYSSLPDLLSTGSLHADVVLAQVSPPDSTGRHSLGLADDYFAAAISSARVVIAEVNDQVPFTFGARTLMEHHCDAMIHTSRPPATLSFGTPSADVVAVARQVAGLVQDGATLQFGIGAMADAVLAELSGHRDLGIHSGLINDAAMTLMQSGVVTGARKTLDRTVAIGGLLGGTPELFAFAHRNPHVELRSTRYTHDPAILAQSHQLAAINGAIEVDLTGQVNAEVAAGRYVGAVGGAVDFLRGAGRSVGGLPIVALPSQARGSSRIVADLSGPVSTPRSEPIIVVTEHGVADLRGLSIEQRVSAMVAIADPSHRPFLEADADRVLASL